jgi:hypothetical protein
MVVYSEYIVVAQLEDVKGVLLFQVQGGKKELKRGRAARIM